MAQHLVIVLDQITKYLAETMLAMHQPVPVLPSFNLMLTYNTGAAFSFLADAGGWQRWFFLGLGAGQHRTDRLAGAAQAGGKMAGGCVGADSGRGGRQPDRPGLAGQVIDFIQLYYDRWYWPAFNIADSAITLGAVLLVLESLWSRNPGDLKHPGRLTVHCHCPLSTVHYPLSTVTVSETRMSAHIHLANPRGFCAGVDRAIGIVERALELFGAPIYVRHEVVHNRFVVDDLRQRGAVFVEELDEVPDGATVIFSAHGVAQAVREEAGAARPQGVRRHLPAGDQGAPRSQPPRSRRPRGDPDRPCRPSRGRGHHGPV